MAVPPGLGQAPENRTGFGSAEQGNHMNRSVFNLKESLEETLKESLRNGDTSALVLVYEQQMEFMRFHNGLVWQVSSIFIPFSFAGLGLEFGDDRPYLYSVGWGSIVLLTMWTILAEWHRWMWVHSLYIAGVVENLLGIRDAPPAPPSCRDLHPLASPPRFIDMPVRCASFDFGRLIRLSFLPMGWVLWLGRMYGWG